MVRKLEAGEVTKLCWKCRHCFRDEWGLKCGHPEIPPMDLATGERRYADHERGDSRSKCGREGTLFEPKPPKISWAFKTAWKMRRWLSESSNKELSQWLK